MNTQYTLLSLLSQQADLSRTLPHPLANLYLSKMLDNLKTPLVNPHKLLYERAIQEKPISSSAEGSLPTVSLLNGLMAPLNTLNGSGMIHAAIGGLNNTNKLPLIPNTHSDTKKLSPLLQQAQLLLGLGSNLMSKAHDHSGVPRDLSMQPILQALSSHSMAVKEETQPNPSPLQENVIHPLKQEKVPILEDANTTKMTVSEKNSRIPNQDEPIPDNIQPKPKKAVHKKVKTEVPRSEDFEDFHESEEEEEEDQEDEVFKPTKHSYYVTKRAIKEKRVLPKREVPKEESKKEPDENDKMAMVQELTIKIEEILGHGNLDQQKVLTLLLKSEVSVHKAIIRLKRNLYYYKRLFKE